MASNILVSIDLGLKRPLHNPNGNNIQLKISNKDTIVTNSSLSQRL